MDDGSWNSLVANNEFFSSAAATPTSYTLVKVKEMPNDRNCMYRGSHHLVVRFVQFYAVDDEFDYLINFQSMINK